MGPLFRGSKELNDCFGAAKEADGAAQERVRCGFDVDGGADFGQRGGQAFRLNCPLALHVQAVSTRAQRGFRGDRAGEAQAVEQSDADNDYRAGQRDDDEVNLTETIRRRVGLDFQLKPLNIANAEV